MYTSLTRSKNDLTNDIKDVNGTVINKYSEATAGRSDVFASFPLPFNNRELNRGLYKLEHQIFLPVPLNLQTDYKMKYSDESFLKTYQELGGSLAGLIGTVGGAIATRGAGAAAKAGGVAAGANVGAIVTTLFNSAGGILGQASKAGAFSQGLALNPHQEYYFNKVEFRKFKLEYNLMAKSVDESNDIKDIIDILKIGMHPGIYGTSLLFTYPSEFELLLYRKDKDPEKRLNRYLFKTKRCVLEQLSVKYNGSDSFVTFKDTNAPVDIQISLDFSEIDIIVREDIEKMIEEERQTY
jgi:hypothetical protein